MADEEEESEGWKDFDPKTWADLTRNERRELHKQFLYAQARDVGINLRPEDYEHEDLDEELDQFCMSDEQIRNIKENERRLIRRVVEVTEAEDRARALRPQYHEPMTGVYDDPEPSTRSQPYSSVPNVVRLDNCVRSEVSDELKMRLMAYAPVERIYALVSSWRLKQSTFENVAHFSGQLVRFGCTCITKPEGIDGGICEYTLDAYYQTKKDEAEKKRQRRKEIRTAKTVAKTVTRIGTLLRNMDVNAPMIVGEGEDDEVLRERAYATATGNTSSFTQNTEVLEEQDVPPFADDHVQLVVELGKAQGESRLVIRDAYFVVRDVVY